MTGTGHASARAHTSDAHGCSRYGRTDGRMGVGARGDGGTGGSGLRWAAPTRGRGPKFSRKPPALLSRPVHGPGSHRRILGSHLMGPLGNLWQLCQSPCRLGITSGFHWTLVSMSTWARRRIERACRRGKIWAAFGRRDECVLRVGAGARPSLCVEPPALLMCGASRATSPACTDQDCVRCPTSRNRRQPPLW